MVTLKSLSAAIVMLVLSVLVGCSDSILSPESNAGEINTAGNYSQVPADHFQTKLTLKPGEVRYFSRRNTGINIFHAVTVNDCYKNNIEVIGFSGDLAFFLECSLKGFSASSISIENKSNIDKIGLPENSA